MSPTYNERENIDQFLTRVRSSVPQADIFIVDDNSPDGTAARVAEWASKDSAVYLLTRHGARGYAEASREGLTKIASEGYDVIITIDCDLSHDPEVIPRMLQCITAGADLVIGSRYVRGGGVEDWSVFRRMLSRCGNRYTALMLGVHARDCTSGFRAYRVDVIRSGVIGLTTSTGYAFLSEVLFRLPRNQRISIHEIPIVYRERTSGESKMNRTIISESMRLVTKWGGARIIRCAIKPLLPRRGTHPDHS
jgi:dolichol-phosphate mannosyltransferase